MKPFHFITTLPPLTPEESEQLRVALRTSAVDWQAPVYLSAASLLTPARVPPSEQKLPAAGSAVDLGQTRKGSK